MSAVDNLDCIVIGYNEIPFDTYESILRVYGANSEAYRDLKFSFLDLGEKKLSYVGLLNLTLNNVNAQHGHIGIEGNLKSGDTPNLAAAYLTNFLRARGYTADYINLFQEEKETLIDYLARDPYCVAITTTFYVMNLPVNEMVSFIRKHNSKVKIIVGGPLVSNHFRNYPGEKQFARDGSMAPELITVLDDMGADIYVVEGQGEYALSQIIGSFKGDKSLEDVPNIVYWDKGEYRRTKIVPENNSLDENLIDWRIFREKRIGATVQARTARSCAFSCSFCNYPTRAGKLTLAGLDTIAKELDSARALGGVQNIIFIDDTFNVPLSRFKDICRMMIEKSYGFNWFSYFRCSNSDEEAIELMAKSGCKGVFLGIESGSPTILKNMNKAATIEKYAEGIKLLHQHNILTFGSFILGFPGETDDTVKDTVRFIRANRPTYYRAQLWYCEPGTPIDRHREKYGIAGEGFVWSHATMNSKEAMGHIENLFLEIDESIWLPQWSFDFWIIPYLLGKGISLGQLKDFMVCANKLLTLNFAQVPDCQKEILRQEYLRNLTNSIRPTCRPEPAPKDFSQIERTLSGGK